MHQARWMARNLCALKLFPFAGSLGYDRQVKMKLQRIVTCMTLFYTSQWMSAMSAPDSPVNDIVFIHEMMKFRETDQEVADVFFQN